MSKMTRTDKESAHAKIPTRDRLGLLIALVDRELASNISVCRVEIIDALCRV